MKHILVLVFLIHYSLLTIRSQDIPSSAEQQLENLADTDQAETEDDSYLQQLEQFRRQPLNLNTADAPELKELRLITDLQIENLLIYRRLLGGLVSIYELQAVPSWDIATIRKLLPFITVRLSLSSRESIKQRIKGGNHSLLLRFSQVLERSKGFEGSTAGTKYLGSPQRFFFRYRYTYKNLLQFGITGDKDAGEQFFKGAQNKGFDFYSFHLFVRKVGSIQALAIGDFTVNMGQGLIQWQSLAFKKSADVMAIKRQSPVIRPYNSAGEFNFLRGAGITFKKSRVDASVFASIRKLSANRGADTLLSQDLILSFLMSGYHRTAGEITDRNSLQQITLGSNLGYSIRSLHVGVNGIYHSFSLPVGKKDEPYNLYGLSGRSWFNLSVDYSYTYKNLHFFGEAAADKHFNKAFINGILISVDPAVDISFLHRHIAKEYQAVNGNAFTENIYPGNETGLYAGITIRPASAWKIDAYGDIYRFPWLKYMVDAPGHGKDMLLQLTYIPGKRIEICSGYKTVTRQGNMPGNTTTTNYLIQLSRQNWRIQLNYKINAAVAIRNRVELVWNSNKSENKEQGFLMFFDLIYKPLTKAYSITTRLQYFETGGYDSRLYAFENDVLFSHSIPVFFDKGYRYYLNASYQLANKISLWIRWAQTIYGNNKGLLGSGLDEIPGNKKSELKIQLNYLF